jgi:hypothetical protein
MSPHQEARCRRTRSCLARDAHHGTWETATEEVGEVGLVLNDPGCDVLLEAISVDPVVESWIGLSDWMEGACCNASTIIAGSGSYDVW